MRRLVGLVKGCGGAGEVQAFENTCTCQDTIDSTCQHQLLFGLEGQQLVCGDEGRSRKLGAGLVQRLRHKCLCVGSCCRFIGLLLLLALLQLLFLHDGQLLLVLLVLLCREHIDRGGGWAGAVLGAGSSRQGPV